jgi:hypothetical protein
VPHVARIIIQRAAACITGSYHASGYVIDLGLDYTQAQANVTFMNDHGWCVTNARVRIIQHPPSYMQRGPCTVPHTVAVRLHLPGSMG